MNTDQLLDFLSGYYVAIVASLFVFIVILEMIVPLVRNHEHLSFRWFTNLAITFLNLFVLKLVGPIIAFLTALLAGYLELGLLNITGLTLIPMLLVGVVILDFKGYWFHRLMHYFDSLWRIHQVHHSDVEVDITTGLRFHPLEAILSAVVSVIVIMMLGITPETIVLHNLLVYFSNFFSHGNIYLPPKFDRYLKWILVTPSMHHLHHVVDKTASNRNFSVCFSVWDRIFGTFMSKHPQAEKLATERDYQYGLMDNREAGRLNLFGLTLLPFKSVPADQIEPTNN